MKIRFLVIMTLWTAGKCFDEEETEEEQVDRFQSQLAFTLFDLTDLYDEVSGVQRDVLLHAASHDDKVSVELKYNKYLRNQSVQMKLLEEDDVPSDYRKMYEFLIKPNFAALGDESLKLIRFSNSMEEMSENNIIGDPDDSNKDLYRPDYEDKLATSRNVSYLETIWSGWQSNISSADYNFTEILFLTEKAASLNDNYDIVKYWEKMVQYSGGYTDAKTVWEEIEPFYKKFHQFVLDRINNYYKTNFTNLPVYLTGSKFGEDWSGLADIVLPHQQIYHDAVTSLGEKTKKGIYLHCSKVADALKFKESGKGFWKNSKFDFERCSSDVISFCSDEYSMILTCNKTSWTQYLDMQDKAFEVGIRNLGYPSLPYRSSSFVDEALQSFGSTVAIHNLAHDEFIEKDAFTTHKNATENFLTAKLLVALRVLPKLAYYYAADTWRINEVQYPSGDIVKSWWDERLKYQGVQGITNNETDFLEDEYIITNKPYLGKFLGTVLQFSFLSPLDFPSEENPNIVTQLVTNDFSSVIQDILFKEPRDIISWHYSIDTLRYYDIKSFFSPLEEYFDAAPLEPHPFERRKLNKKVEVMTVVESTTSLTVSEQTPKQNVSLARKETASEVETPENAPNVPAVPEKADGYSIGIYILITVAACVLIMVALLVFKRLVKMRRPRTNNRRFEA